MSGEVTYTFAFRSFDLSSCRVLSLGERIPEGTKGLFAWFDQRALLIKRQGE
jgi:hypothetical protein